MKGKENKPHIGIYGCRNVGKSSLINFLTNQQVAIVSDQKGTTTDPVKRSFELPGIGAVVFIDTAGIDDEGELGQARVTRTLDTIKTVDLALLVIEPTTNPIELNPFEQNLITEFQKTNTPYILVVNKCDTINYAPTILPNNKLINCVSISSKIHQGKNELLMTVKKLLPQPEKTNLFYGLINSSDIVLLITPIDNGAPQGRLILPQVTAIRNIIDENGVAVVLKENEVEQFLQTTKIKPALVVTDSQIFKQADKLIPKNISLTSFSILMARMKGNFEAYLQGVSAIDSLKDGDRIIMLENCSHHSSCDDIGRVKIPAWLQKYTGKHLEFDMTQGLDKFTRPITDYALAIQCGGCMATHKQLLNRISPIIEAGVPVTNYGMVIAYTQGIFERATELFQR